METKGPNYLIRTDGALTPCAPENGTDYKLAQLYRMLACDTVEVVNLRDGRILICDENSKASDDHEVNVAATRIAKSCGALFPGDYIAGPAILCRDEELR